jgi:hypothetical protein
MAMAARFGQIGPKEDGLFKRVNWPQLAMMDERTGDGRLLMGDGGGVRNLPRTGFVQFAQLPGHSGSVAALRLDEVTFEAEGNISGAGWIADTDEGHKLATLMAAKILFHNSVDLAEVEYEYKWESDDPSDPGFWNLLGIDFTEWNIAATTIVGVPAFRDARAELVASFTDDTTAEEIIASLESDEDWWAEITAALESDEPLEGIVDRWTIRLPEEVRAETEMVASAAAVIMNWADFYMPESPKLQKIVVTPDGAVFGHLAMDGDEHGSRPGVTVPRPSDNYASFNQPGPWTEKGQVETGPIFFLGGHPDHPLGARTPDQAYGGVENAWADVRVTQGRLGPWISGRVRPGMSENAIHVARCSRISGHWKGDKLVAIVSVNVPAFNVPGTGMSFDRGGAEFRNGQLELVASMYGPDETPETAYAELEAATPAFTDEQRAEVARIVREALSAARPSMSFAAPPPEAMTSTTDTSPDDDATDADDDDALADEAEALYAWSDLGAELS